MNTMSWVSQKALTPKLMPQKPEIDMFKGIFQWSHRSMYIYIYIRRNVALKYFFLQKFKKFKFNKVIKVLYFDRTQLTCAQTPLKHAMTLLKCNWTPPRNLCHHICACLSRVWAQVSVVQKNLIFY